MPSPGASRPETRVGRGEQGTLQRPLVSVIVPAFNAEAFLSQAIESVAAQSLTDWEAIIVDDCSCDRTPALAEALAAADPRIRAIASPENRGPAAARNRGLAEAQGVWIALLDADDAFEPDRLSRLVGIAQDTGADLLADNLLLEDETGYSEAMLPLSEAASCAPITSSDFLRGNLPDPKHPRKSYGFLKPLIARQFLEENGLCYDEDLRFAEDFAFYLDCFAAKGRFFLCQEPLYRYRLRSDSLTAAHSIDDLRRLQSVDQRFLDHAEEGRSDDFLPALREHKKSIDQRLQWRVFIEEVKGGSWPRALLASLKGWHVFSYVSAQLLSETWRRLSQGRLGSTPA